MTTRVHEPVMVERRCLDVPRLPVALRHVVLCATALLGAACEDQEAREPLPDWSEGYPDAATDSGAPGLSDAFGFVFPDSLEFYARLGLRDALDEPCAIAREDAPKMIDCIADMNELDPWVLGFKYDIYVPSGMCDFILHVPYMFANFPIGEGPERVAYTVHETGTFSDETNAMNGKPFCEYNHKQLNPDAPNCCFGTYTLEVTNAETGVINTSQASWGGRLGDCYYGAAYVETGVAKDADGVPMPRYRYMHRREYVEHIEFEGVSDKYPANVGHANYFDPADHGDTMPAALAAPGAYPYYEAYCLNDAEEIVAHIRMSVREWNEEVELNNKGDPDTVGTEPAFEGGPIQIDDLADWKVLTPGSVGLPEIRVAL